jgi:hypothetical protein
MIVISGHVLKKLKTLEANEFDVEDGRVFLLSLDLVMAALESVGDEKSFLVQDKTRAPLDNLDLLD